jgi:hypothetical protein
MEQEYRCWLQQNRHVSAELIYQYPILDSDIAYSRTLSGYPDWERSWSLVKNRLPDIVDVLLELSKSNQTTDLFWKV